MLLSSATVGAVGFGSVASGLPSPSSSSSQISEIPSPSKSGPTVVTSDTTPVSYGATVTLPSGLTIPPLNVSGSPIPNCPPSPPSALLSWYASFASLHPSPSLSSSKKSGPSALAGSLSIGIFPVPPLALLGTPLSLLPSPSVSSAIPSLSASTPPLSSTSYIPSLSASKSK